MIDAKYTITATKIASKVIIEDAEIKANNKAEIPHKSADIKGLKIVFLSDKALISFLTI